MFGEQLSHLRSETGGGSVNVLGSCTVQESLSASRLPVRFQLTALVVSAATPRRIERGA